MWLIIRKSDGAVIGHQRDRDPTEFWDSLRFEVKEWLGVPPPLHNPEEGVLSYDPTLSDPSYPSFLQSQIDFDEQEVMATEEIDWLNDIIPQIDTMTAAEVRNVVKRLAQENLRQIKAWRYVFRRFA